MVTMQKDLADFPTFQVHLLPLGQLSFTHGLDGYPNILQLTLGEPSIQLSDHFTKIPASVGKGRGRRGAEGVEPSASPGKEELGLYEDQRRSQAEPGQSVGTKPPISRSLQVRPE